MMGSVLTINKDGTGTRKDYSALFGDRSWDLVWRHIGTGHLQIIEFWEGENNEITDESWDNIYYKATWIKSDVSDRVPVLKNPEDHSFWDFVAPVCLISRSE